MNEQDQDWRSDLRNEIHTPLNGIAGMLRLLLETPLRPDQRQAVESARDSAERLLKRTDTLLSSSGRGPRQPVLDIGAFDLTAMVESSTELLAPQAERKGLGLGIYIHPAAMLRLRGDSGRLRQVLINLVANAIKFTRNGTVEVDVRVHPLDGQRVKLRIAVVDTGTGIAPEAQPRIFQAAADAPAGETRGLGLSICHRIVAELGGEIGVDSDPGRGSTFWFAVPMLLADDDPRHAAQDPEAFAGLRALVVDTEETGRRILRRRLQVLGFEVVEGASAADAAATIAARGRAGEGFDLMLVEDAVFGPQARSAFERAFLAAAIKPPRIVVCIPFGAQHPTAAPGGLRAPDAVLTRPIRVAALALTLSRLFVQSADAPGAEPASSPAGAETPPVARPVLVADDNRVNLRLMSAILEREGFAVDVAEDGLAAVEMATRRRYAAILMDVKMPRMNGLEAAARIRTLDGDLAQVPIIALTANTTPGARDLYIAAGMDEHVPKPVNRTELMAVLRRLSTRPTPETEASPGLAPALASASIQASARRKMSAASAMTAPAPGDHADLDERQLAAIQAVLRKSEFERLIATSTDTAEERADGLRAVSAAGDLAALTRAAQDIGSIAANIGARRLNQLAGALERACREHRPEDAERIVPDVADATTRISAELRRRYLRRAG